MEDDPVPDMQESENLYENAEPRWHVSAMLEEAEAEAFRADAYRAGYRACAKTLTIYLGLYGYHPDQERWVQDYRARIDPY